MQEELKQNTLYESRSIINCKTKDNCYIIFPVYNFLTITKERARSAAYGKPDSPRCSYILLTLFTVLIWGAISELLISILEYHNF